MRLFLDTSVLLAASGSASGASREVFRRASANAWVLMGTPYVVEEVLRNLPDLPPAASGDWVRLRPKLVVMCYIPNCDRNLSGSGVVPSVLYLGGGTGLEPG